MAIPIHRKEISQEFRDSGFRAFHGEGKGNHAKPMQTQYITDFNRVPKR